MLNIDLTFYMISLENALVLSNTGRRRQPDLKVISGEYTNYLGENQVPI